jgi:hypothetical protein
MIKCFCLCRFNPHKVFRHSVNEVALCPSRAFFFGILVFEIPSWYSQLAPYSKWKWRASRQLQGKNRWFPITLTASSSSPITAGHFTFLGITFWQCYYIPALYINHHLLIFLFSINYICYLGIYLLFCNLCPSFMHKHLAPSFFVLISAEFFPPRDKHGPAKSYFRISVITVVPFKGSNELYK